MRESAKQERLVGQLLDKVSPEDTLHRYAKNSWVSPVLITHQLCVHAPYDLHDLTRAKSHPHHLS